MKTLLAAVVTALTLLAEPVFAQVASLPIGSTNAVLQDALRQINMLEWDIRLMSKDGYHVEQFLSEREIWVYIYGRDGEPTKLLKQELAKDIQSINWNKPEYTERTFEIWYSGNKDLPQNASYVVLANYNRFILKRNEKGELVPPLSAFTVDLDSSLTLSRGNFHVFFVDNIERAVLEVEDGEGKVIIRQDSAGQGGTMIVTGTTVVPQTGVLLLPIRFVISGDPGRITIWYKSGAQQVFSLADGHLLPSLSVRRAKGGVELIVSSAEPFLIEASENLREWSALYLPPVIEPAAPTLVHRFTDPAEAGRRFYRMRIESALQQNRR